MEVEGVASPEPLIDVDPVPAPGAEDQKPLDPPSDADAQKPEEVETPEQQAAKRESRRARSNARKAAELAEARTEARMLREQLERVQKPQPESGEPKREQYDDYETYLRAVTRYDAEQVASKTLKTANEASQRQSAQSKAEEAQAKAAQAWVEREKTFEAVTPDYQEVVSSYLDDIKADFSALSQQAREFVAEAGAEVLYRLASDEALQDRIAPLSPYRQVAELAKLETSAKEASPAKTASNAPAPIKPVGQGRSAPNGFSDNMSDAEYKAWRKGQGARWAH